MEKSEVLAIQASIIFSCFLNDNGRADGHNIRSSVELASEIQNEIEMCRAGSEIALSKLKRKVERQAG